MDIGLPDFIFQRVGGMTEKLLVKGHAQKSKIKAFTQKKIFLISFFKVLLCKFDLI
jgi:hypothetical protein